MHDLSLLLVAGLAAQASAFPQLAPKVSREAGPDSWQAPGPGDARAPCPGLNTMANHGFINHNGRGITKQQMQQGFLDAFGLAFELTNDGGQNALNLQCDGCKTFDLDTLNQPHKIEHDGSMTRLDKQMPWDKNANNFAFNQSVWDQSLDLYGCNTHVDPVLAQHVLSGRMDEAKRDDAPGWFLAGGGGALAEHGFVLSAMHDYATGPLSKPSARLDWINYWFTHERLPSELGWKKPDPVVGNVYNSIIDVIAKATSTSVAAKTDCALKSTSTPPSSSSTDTSKPTSTSDKSTPSASATPSSGLSVSVSSTTSRPMGTAPPSTTTGLSGSAPFPAGNVTMPAGSGTGTGAGGRATTDKPTSTSSSASSSTTLPSSVSSSAKEKATQLAGSAPNQPDPYHQVLSNQDWQSFTEVVIRYIEIIENLCQALLGSHEIGSMPAPGSSAPGNGAPWMGSMPGSPNAGSQSGSPPSGNPPSGDSNAPPPSSGVTSPVSPGPGGPSYGTCDCKC